MTDRLRSASTVGHPCPPKMESDLSPRKTMLVLVIVVGCFAVLWPKVFYPMLVGSANEHIKPSSIDKTTGCCDVISETDVNTIKIMSELCGTIIKPSNEKPLTGKEIVQRCRKEVLDTCGIDISAVLQEQVRLGQSVKQILDQIRSLNGSLCLKYNYGVSPWRLGVPHTIKTTHDTPNIRQERPMHLRTELVHPAFRERGRAIPHPQQAVPTRPPPRIVEGRPGPIPGMRPTLGGAGHVVPPPKQGTSSMSIIMPIYTIGIVIFFSYTLIKIIFRKQPRGIGGTLYPPVDPDPHFRREVFDSESNRLQPRLSRDISSKLVVNAMSALLDEVDQELENRRKSSEVASQDLVNGTLSNGDVVKSQDAEQPTVKVLGMEMTASCEGGKKWSRPDSPVVPTPSPPPPVETVSPPQEIYLEGALPPQSQLLVAESATEPEPITGEDPAVVLSGKVTLSVISPDSENGTEDTTRATEMQEFAETSLIQPEESPELDRDIQEFLQKIRNENNQPETEEIIQIHEETVEPPIGIEKDIEEFLQKLRNEQKEEITEPIAELTEVTPPSSGLEKDIQEFLATLRKDQEVMQAPAIMLDSEDTPNTIEVESLEKEVDDLIQEAIQSIQQKDTEVPKLIEQTNEINEEIKTDSVVLNGQESQPAALQDSNESFERKEQESPKIQLKEEISNEIEKLIQEIKDIPIVEERINEKIGLTQVQPEERIDENVELSKEILETREVQPTQIEPQIDEKVEEIVEKIIEQRLEVELAPIQDKIEDNRSNIEKEPTNIVEGQNQKIQDVIEDSSTPIGEKEATKVQDIIETIGTANVEETKISEEKEKIKDVVQLERTEVINVGLQTKEKTVAEAKLESKLPEKIEEKITETKLASPETTTEHDKKISDNDEQLASDEELVEEIEEIVYEEESGEEEEIEIEVEEEEEEDEEDEIEEIPDERSLNRTDSSIQRINGERSEDPVEESKNTTVSGATTAENEISDEELIENNEVDDEEEVIEIEEEVEDEDLLNLEGNNVNHLSGNSDAEL